MKQDGFTEQALISGVQEWEAHSRISVVMP